MAKKTTQRPASGRFARSGRPAAGRGGGRSSRGGQAAGSPVQSALNTLTGMLPGGGGKRGGSSSGPAGMIGRFLGGGGGRGRR